LPELKLGSTHASWFARGEAQAYARFFVSAISIRFAVGPTTKSA
jgi:hypothetical protein